MEEHSVRFRSKRKLNGNALSARFESSPDLSRLPQMPEGGGFQQSVPYAAFTEKRKILQHAQSQKKGGYRLFTAAPTNRLLQKKWLPAPPWPC